MKEEKEMGYSYMHKKPQRTSNGKFHVCATSLFASHHRIPWPHGSFHDVILCFHDVRYVLHVLIVCLHAFIYKSIRFFLSFT